MESPSLGRRLSRLLPLELRLRNAAQKTLYRYATDRSLPDLTAFVSANLLPTDEAPVRVRESLHRELDDCVRKFMTEHGLSVMAPATEVLLIDTIRDVVDVKAGEPTAAPVQRAGADGALGTTRVTAARPQGSQPPHRETRAPAKADPEAVFKVLDAALGDLSEIHVRREVVLGGPQAPPGTHRLASPLVSRRHARVLVEGGRVRVADLGSANGTTVNGRPLGREFHDLAPGDELGLAGLRLVYSGLS